jgi:hypothetical protein
MFILWGELLQPKRGRAFLIKRIWFCDKCHTLKSCAGVVLIGAAVAGMLLIIRLVGEARLLRFLNFILFFKHRKPELELVSEGLSPENRF